LLGRRPNDLSPSPLTELAVAQARVVARTGERARLRLVGRGQRRARAWEVWLSPVQDPEGQAHGVLTVSVEVTEQHQARQRLALVNEASTRIGTTLDVTRTAEELVEVSVPQLADLVLVDVLDSVLLGGEPISGPVGTAPMRRMAIGSVLEGCPEVVVRPGEVSSYPGPSPFADCLNTGRTERYDSRAPEMVKWAALSSAQGSSIARHGMHSMAAVPVRARGTTLGTAIFVRHRHAERFEDDDVVLAEEIVARAAVCIDNARRYTREHATALALQTSLLQQRRPVVSAVQVAARYWPAQSGVGGDWFDVIRLSGSRVGLVVGDVVGHGIHAAATMGRLRTAVRTLADIDLEPEELLTRLNDVVTRLAEDELSPGDAAAEVSATCLYAVYDPISRRCTLARAGHPVPAVVDPGGSVEFLDLPAGPPLGLGGLPFEETEIELPEGSLLVLYTDGLVESRQRDIDAGLAAMRKVLSEVHAGREVPPSLEAVCDRLVGDLLPDRAGDDAAVLVARTRALSPDKIACWELPAQPSVVGRARAGAAEQLAIWGLEDITFTTELLVSELVTNAIRHAQPRIQLRLIWDGVLSVEVSDASSTSPHLRRADRYDEDGRGLMLVAQLADRWGTRHTRTGKTIWALQPVLGGR
jgi:serine phosphatase RsbU (regulator of sigma subunit)/anti-sigma regulatory factor (Ser/Thr protein kinase)